MQYNNKRYANAAPVLYQRHISMLYQVIYIYSMCLSNLTVILFTRIRPKKTLIKAIHVFTDIVKVRYRNTMFNILGKKPLS